MITIILPANYHPPSTMQRRSSRSCHRLPSCELMCTQSTKSFQVYFFPISFFRALLFYHFIWIQMSERERNASERWAHDKTSFFPCLLSVFVTFFCFASFYAIFFFIFIFFAAGRGARSALVSVFGVISFLMWQARTVGRKRNLRIIICLFTRTNDKLNGKWKSSQTCHQLAQQMQTEWSRQTPIYHLFFTRYHALVWWSSKRGNVMRKHGRVRFHFNWNAVFSFIHFV